MGRTYAKVKMWNMLDEPRMRRGEEIPVVQVRAQVDNGSTFVIVPPSIVEELELMKEEKKTTVRYADERRAEREVALGLRLEILGRSAECKAVIEPRRKEPLIGQIALEGLDLWIDSKRGRLIPNPESPDAPLLDALGCSETQARSAAGALANVLEKHPKERSSLIPLLQEVQDELGYLPPEAMREVARHLNMPESAVYGVVTFYAQFYLTRQGRHRVKVCQGTACHVRGSRRVMEGVQKRLGIEPGETTPDYEFSLERVACFGSCALAPVMVVDGRVYGKLTPARAARILKGLE